MESAFSVGVFLFRVKPLQRDYILSISSCDTERFKGIIQGKHIDEKTDEYLE